MKKACILACILCLLFSSALAENNVITNESTSKEVETLISYTIEANKAYTVTIPSVVSIGDNKTSTLNVTLAATEYQLNPGNTNVYFKVSLFTQNMEFYHPDLKVVMNNLSNGTDQIGYIITGENIQHATDTSYFDGPIIEAFADDIVNPVTCSLVLTTQPIGTESPGEYTDTLTFKVEVFET